MNKKFKITGLATAALASVILAGANMSGNVKAAEKDADINAAQVTQVQPAKQETTKNTAQSTTTDTKQDSTKDEGRVTTYDEQAKVVEKAKNDVNSMQLSVNYAQNHLENVQKEIKEAKGKDSAAAREEYSKQAKVVQAKSKVATEATKKLVAARNPYIEANSSAAKAKNQLSILNSEKDAWTKIAENNKNENSVKEAKEKLAKIEKQLPEVQANYDKLQKAADEAKDAYDTALKANNDAVKEVTTETAKLNKLRAIVEPEQYLNSAKQILSSYQSALEKAQKTLSEEEAKLDALKPAESEDTSSTTTAPVTDDTATSTTDTNKTEEITDTTTKEETSDKQEEVKSYKLTHNAFVYDKNGKRVKLSWIKRGKTIKALKTVTINGKKYYQIGENKFIKVANTKIKTKAVKVRATIKGNKKVATVSRSGRKNGHYVAAGHIYKFNEKATINGKTYYKISGKNNWVVANKLSIKK